MRRALLTASAIIAFCPCSWAQLNSPAISGSPLSGIGRENLCVTNGIVSGLPGGRMAIETPSSRAVVQIATAQTAEIRFRYLGPSEGSKPLASGELRRQIGLKLRAQDTCNLLYAMWHIEPDSRVAVSIKRNPGQHAHEECGARGYVNLKPRTGVVLPKILPGESHVLRATLNGADLILVADGRVAWEGNVGNGVSEFDGPVGFRTDNARFEFEYYAGPIAGTELSKRRTAAHRCLSSPGD
jgi:hypothetical protein